MRGTTGPILALALAAGAGGCASAPRPPAVDPLPAVAVAASGETAPVGTADADAADDPAIWRNAAAPARSLIVATDKKAGLYVYGLDGGVRSFHDAGRVNNVDLVDAGADGVIVAASDRNDPARAAVQVFRLDTATATLVPLGTVAGGSGEGYGLCMARIGGATLAYLVLKDGTVRELRLTTDGNTVSGEPLRTMKLATQAEGCVADPRDGTLYVGEEDRGIWRFAPGAREGVLVAPVDGRQLVADVEGLAIMPEGEDGGMLVASSQGDSAYALYRLPGMVPAGRFRIAAGPFGATQETDGIDLRAGDFGPDYPDGLFVAQDGDNRPAAQNFKLVSWRAILSATGRR